MVYEDLDVISAEEFQRDPDTYIEQAKQERHPIRIREQNGREVVLISWEHYLERLGELLSVDELTEITEAMKNYG